MELDIIKSQTTWNEASGSINSNFSKVRQAIIALQEAEGGGGSGSGGEGIDEAQLEAYLTLHKYVTQSWVGNAFSDYDSAIKQWVNDQGFITSTGGGDIDLSDYAKKADLEALTTRFDAVFDGREDQDDYINKWHELVKFLDGIEEGDSLANTLVNQDDRLLALEDMFAWEYDSEGNRTAIRAKSHFFSTGQVAAGGIGTEPTGGGGGISLLFDSTKTWADYTSAMADYALAAYHGKALNDRLVAVENKEITADDIEQTQEKNFVSMQDIEYWNTAYLPKTGGTLKGSLVPDTDGAYHLGSSSYRLGVVFALQGVFYGGLSINHESVATQTWADGRYLPLSGGTITGNIKIESGVDRKIILDNTDTDNKYQFISFRQNGTEYGQLGTAFSDDLVWGKEGYEKIILHSGNIGSYARSYALLIDGSNKMSAGIAWEDYSIGTNVDDFGEGLFMGRNTTAGTSLANFSQYAAVLNCSAGVYRFQIASLAASKGYFLFRSYNANTNIYDEWKRVAFTDSNVASATKLETARTIWGQSFDGTGDVDGSLSITAGNITLTKGYQFNFRNTADNTYIESISFRGDSFHIGYGNINKYDTYIQGKNIVLRPGAGGEAMRINSSGNVTIGSSDLAGTAWRFYVDGGARIGDITMSQSSIGLNRNVNSGAVIDNSYAVLWLDTSSNRGTIHFADTTGVRRSYITLATNGVGIGTSDPQYKLDVNGVARASGLIGNNVCIACGSDGTTSGYGGEINRFGGGNLYIQGREGGLILGFNGNTTTVRGMLVVNRDVTIGNSTSGILKIGNAILSWDSTNNALKIEGNVYATGQVASGGIGTAVATIASDHEDRIAQLEAKVESLMS